MVSREADPRWTEEEIADGARIFESDVERALRLIREASPELLEMIEATEENE